jgi:YfiH family protein
MFMPFRQINSLRIYQFEIFKGCDLTHGIATRRGGISPEPWDSLNVGASVGDELDRVHQNIGRIFKALSRDPESKYDVWQIHSNHVQVVEAPRGNAAPIKADIITTNLPGVTLLLRFADCVPIMLYDPIVKAAALVHAGREGLVRRTPIVAVKAMAENFGSKPSNLLAGIGPSICVNCYSVGEEVLKDFEDTMGKDATNRFFKKLDGSYHLDLWSCSQVQLESTGVTKIENSGICTAMNLEDWYSHRAEKGRTGRFAALMGVDP